MIMMERSLAIIYGVLGGVLALYIGPFGAALGGGDWDGDPAGAHLVGILSVVLAVVAFAGAALACYRPTPGGVVMLLSAVAIVALFGFEVGSIVSLVFLFFAAIVNAPTIRRWIGWLVGRLFWLVSRPFVLVFSLFRHPAPAGGKA
jgi:hypothetical protein